MEVPALMFHGPHGQQQPAADPGDPGQLSECHGSTLHRRKVVDHRNREHCVERFIAIREAEIVADYHLEIEKFLTDFKQKRF